MDKINVKNDFFKKWNDAVVKVNNKNIYERYEDEKGDILKNKINTLNKEIKKIYSYIDKNENIFDYMDLKLHDTSYYIYSQMDEDFKGLEESKESIFQSFICVSYDIFISDLKLVHSIDFNNMIKHIGRTSSFYLYKNIDYNQKNIYLIDELIAYYYGYPILIDYIYNDYFFEFNDDMIKDFEDLTEEIDYLIDELYNYFILSIKDIKIVYDYIKDFKDNQIKYFKEFLTNNYYEVVQC